MSNKQDVATKKTNAVATIDIEKFADQGFENIDSKSLQLPFLKILGQLSPQVTAGDSKYIDAAKPGMIYNTVTDKLYDGGKGILVIPAYYKFEYIEWADRGQDNQVAELVRVCEQHGFKYLQKQKVEPMTLKAFAKEQVEKGKELPFDLFGIYIANKAKLKTKE